MLIEQIIDFKFGEPGPPCRTCTFITGYFNGKMKIDMENFRVDYYLLLRYCRRKYTFLTPTWTESFSKFNT